MYICNVYIYIYMCILQNRHEDVGHQVVRMPGPIYTHSKLVDISIYNCNIINYLYMIVILYIYIYIHIYTATFHTKNCQAQSL